MAIKTRVFPNSRFLYNNYYQFTTQQYYIIWTLIIDVSLHYFILEENIERSNFSKRNSCILEKPRTALGTISFPNRFSTIQMYASYMPTRYNIIHASRVSNNWNSSVAQNIIYMYDECVCIRLGRNKKQQKTG